MVSAIVLAYNRCAEVLITIQKLKDYRQSFPYELEIIVVDNASVDDTTAQVQNKHPDVVLITKPKNNGIAGWNEGFKIARHKYFLVLDDDSHINSGLAEAVRYMNQHESTGILAFSIVDEQLKGDPFLRPEDAYQDLENLTGFVGCGALIRKEVYFKIGGYSEWVYLYTHEYEYGIRCLDAGYAIQNFEKAIVVHRTSAINRSKARMRTYSTRNEMGIVYKYFATNRLGYLFRVLFNNLKFIKREGLKTGYYVLSGAYEFIKLKSRLRHVPVSASVQVFYANHYWSTKPVWTNLKKRFSLGNNAKSK